MQILLHIGMHKTGSTAIQQAMKSYDDGDTIYARIGIPNHSVAFQSAFNRNYQNYSHFDREGLTPRQRDVFHVKSKTSIEDFLHRSTHRRVIFSGEDITSLDRASIGVMLETLGRFSDDIRAVAYLRDPVGHARSNIQEVLKTGYADLLRAMQPRYRPRLEKFRDLLGADHTDFYLFDRNRFAGGSVVDDFASRMDLDRRRMKTVEANQSLSIEAQKALYLLNRSDLPSLGTPKLKAARQRFRHLMDRLLPKGPEPDARLYLPHFDQADLNWASRELGFAFESPPATGMPQSLEDAYASLMPESLEMLAMILQKNGLKTSFKRDPDKLVCQVFHLCLGAGPVSLNRYSPNYLPTHPYRDALKSFLRWS